MNHTTSHESRQTTRQSDTPPTFTQSQQTHQQTISLLHKMAHILHVKLDKEEIAILLELCDRGLSVEALVSIVKELKDKSDMG
mmetsp:Transcript_2898/g.11054  ORF Transcript_2898/g.11054 Transcript_2898/m.11054 type:complete len:83 (+) Transcript_2898:8575-8823(+)